MSDAADDRTGSGAETLARAGLPPGLTARAPVLDDAPALFALVRACDVAVLGSTDATLVQTAADVAAPGYDREHGGLVVEDASGAVVGWLWTEDDAEAGSVFVDPYSLDADVTAWLAHQGLRYARSVARGRGRPVGIDAGSFERAVALVSALEGIGLGVRRRFWRMRIELGGGTRPPPVQPSGVTVRRPDPDSEDTHRLLYHLVSASLAEHWGHADRSYRDWRERFDAAGGRDPAQWWVAEVDDDPAGVLIGDDSRAELGIAWVKTLGVLEPYRGRGIGKLLLRTAFAAAAGRGMAAVGLAVDSENPTGATALYESVGMRVESVLLAWKGHARP